jgi:hypothetical protein
MTCSFISDGILFLPVTNQNTNIGYRIANFLMMMQGSNALQPLDRYSSHILEHTEDGQTLRGAFGPRIRNWIGCHQLQDCINTNADIDEEDKMTKPQGVDQTLAVFDDLKHGCDSTAFVIRDPGIDFDESMDIPDCLGIVFNMDKAQNLLKVNAMYEVAGNPNYLNEVWAISYLTQMYAAHLNVDHCRLNIIYPAGDSDFNGYDGLVTAKKNFCSGVDSEQFFADLEVANSLFLHIHCQFNEKSFNTPDVSVYQLSSRLLGKVFSVMKCDGLKDMIIALVIWNFLKYGDQTDHSMNEYVESVFQTMSDSMITKELAQYIFEVDTPYNLREAAKEHYEGA